MRALFDHSRALFYPLSLKEYTHTRTQNTRTHNKNAGKIVASGLKFLKIASKGAYTFSDEAALNKFTSGERGGSGGGGVTSTTGESGGVSSGGERNSFQSSGGGSRPSSGASGSGGGKPPALPASTNATSTSTSTTSSAPGGKPPPSRPRAPSTGGGGDASSSGVPPLKPRAPLPPKLTEAQEEATLAFAAGLQATLWEVGGTGKFRKITATLDAAGTLVCE